MADEIILACEDDAAAAAARHWRLRRRHRTDARTPRESVTFAGWSGHVSLGDPGADGAASST